MGCACMGVQRTDADNYRINAPSNCSQIRRRLLLRSNRKRPRHGAVQILNAFVVGSGVSFTFRMCLQSVSIKLLARVVASGVSTPKAA